MNRDYGWQHRGVDGASGSGGGNDAEQKQTEKSANERYTHHTERARRNAIPTIHISFYSLAFFPSIQFCGVGAIRLGFTFIFVLIPVIFLMVFCTPCCMRVHRTHTHRTLEHSHLTQNLVRSTARFSVYQWHGVYVSIYCFGPNARLQ